MSSQDNLLSGFLLGTIVGAAVGFLYSQNKDEVDSRVKKALKNARDMTEDKLDDAKDMAADTLHRSGKNISTLGSKLSKTIEDKADEIGQKAEDLTKNLRHPNSRR